MSQNSFPHSPTYQSPSHPSKTSRLYQQLLQNNYLNDHIYHPNTPATIKFASPATIKFNTPNYQDSTGNSDRDIENYSSSKYPNPFKTFESGKMSHQITQSLPSNYSIQQIENESYSTINLYNLSRNNIEPDLSLSSNNITAKLNLEASHHPTPSPSPSESKNSILYLEGSTNNKAPTIQEISCLQLENLKKYRSEQYQPQSNRDPLNQEEEQEQSPLPKLLANKYLKNDITRKFSGSHPSEQEQENFKTVLNQIHVVPYKINEEVQPYAFSAPIEQLNNSIEKRGKATSLNLNRSKISENNEQQHKKPLYFSNHPHLNAQHQPLHLSTHNTPFQSQNPKQPRSTPKSQPKIHHLSHEKTARSNSIGCKSKPVPPKPSEYNQMNNTERLDQSKVSRVFKQNEGNLIQEKILPSQEKSIIYDEKQISLCCGMRFQQERSNLNRINFIPQQEQRATVFCEAVPSQQITNLGIGSKRSGTYKINTLKVIKSLNESRESESQKKGIKLIGFNSSFPRRNEE